MFSRCFYSIKYLFLFHLAGEEKAGCLTFVRYGVLCAFLSVRRCVID